MPRRILLLDTEPTLAARLEQHLREDGYEVWSVPVQHPHWEAAVRAYAFDLVLFDTERVKLTPASWMRWMRQIHPYAVFVAMTRTRTVTAAIAWMRTGVVDYVEKPLRKDRLSSWCKHWLAEKEPHAEILPAPEDDFPITGVRLNSKLSQTLRERAYFWSQQEVPVVLTGEEGSEKESIAIWMHKQSTRRYKPWESIQWATLLSKQKQGGISWKRWCHRLEGGAVWVEMEVRQAKEYLFQDCGVWVPGIRWYVGLSAKTVQLPAEIVQIRVPPLRERPEDAVMWTLHWMQEWAQQRGKVPLRLTPQARRWVMTQSWPGNERQLQSMVQQALQRVPHGLLDESHFVPLEAPPVPLGGMALDVLEQQALFRTLEVFGGNKTATAKTLGISRRTLYNKLAFYKMR